MKLFKISTRFKKISNTEKNSFKVDYRFKIIYFIAILSVIASHLQGKGSIELSIQGWFPYATYHMPLFMFSAGYFFKDKNIGNTSNYITRKFLKLILPIYSYNFFYGLFMQFLKKFGFKYIVDMSFKIILIYPLGGSGFPSIRASWFASCLFFVELYNITKRKFLSLIKVKPNESIYFIFDFFLSYYSIYFSKKGYKRNNLYNHILRIMHLNIYYEIGMFFNKYLENYINTIRNDAYFISIFIIKLSFYLYYSKIPAFSYVGNEFFNYSPLTVIIISILGILFWFKVAANLEFLIGTNFYINIIADNTYSIMINHFLAIFLVSTLFAFISKYTKYCNDFDFKKYYSTDDYVYLPNKILQAGIIYFLSCLIIPIIIQKIINRYKFKIQKLFF